MLFANTHSRLDRDDDVYNLQKMALSTATLKQRIADNKNIEKTPELQRTLAVMPFLGSGMGSGMQSKLELDKKNRFIKCCTLLFRFVFYRPFGVVQPLQVLRDLLLEYLL